MTRRAAVLGFLLLVIVMTALRVQLTPPAWFVEGDDAALCAGIASLCAEDEIGAYAYHPPRLPVLGDPAAEVEAWRAMADDNLSMRMYRYDSMSGMYLLGRMTRGLGPTAPRMAWLCFVAGTFFPILVALFMVRLLRPSSIFAFPVCWALVSLAPEPWVSGAAYINDKIVAGTFLFGALCLLQMMSRSPKVLQSGLVVASAGLLFALSVLTRFDSLMFYPAAVAVCLATARDRRGALLKTVPFFVLVSSGLTIALAYVARASLLNALLSGAEYTGRYRLGAKILAIRSALGDIQIVLGLLLLGAMIWLILRNGQRPKGEMNLQTPTAADRIRQGAVLLLIIGPEVGLLMLLPFQSQKYLLNSAAVLAGLVAVIPFLLWDGRKSSPMTIGRPRLCAGLMSLIFILPVLAATVRYGDAIGSDGQRFLGGYLDHPLQEAADSKRARKLVSVLSDPRNGESGHFVVPAPGWIIEGSLAYQCVEHGWEGRVTPTDATVPVDRVYRPMGSSARRDWITRQMYDHGLIAHEQLWIRQDDTVSDVRLTMLSFSPPGSSQVSISIPANWDAFHFRDVLTERVLAEAVGEDVTFVEPLASHVNRR